jgi:hypothetical protein
VGSGFWLQECVECMGLLLRREKKCAYYGVQQNENRADEKLEGAFYPRDACYYFYCTLHDREWASKPVIPRWTFGSTKLTNYTSGMGGLAVKRVGQDNDTTT